MQICTFRANLVESSRETKHQHEVQIVTLNQELENEACRMKKVERENDNKRYEIESLKLELKTMEQHLQSSRENTKELADKCCVLIEQDTENQVGR